MLVATVRKWISLGMLAIFMSGCSGLQSGNQPPKACCERFNFVVIGDTRTGVPIFKRNIADINQLDPDFVVDVGDLINGGQSDAAKINAMWDEFDQIVKAFQVPFIMVAGNHDISNPVSEKIYYQRYGQTYFAFDYRNAHFIVLDSETLNEKGAPIDEIGGDQLAWLREDLAAHPNAALTFVFLHKPLWTGPTAGAWMKDVQPLLARHHVAAVFAGHVHRYTKFPPIDGVRYYVTGGGGAEIGADEATGDFHHFCFVSATPPNWRLAVIKTGSVLPDTVVESRPTASGPGISGK